MSHSLVLYMIYYPPHLKYVEVDVDLPDDLPPAHIKTPVKREQWKLSITLSWVIFWHMCVFLSVCWLDDSCTDFEMFHCSAFLVFITFMLLSTNPTPSEDYRSPQLELWATFLGVSSALLATFQYTPQIAHTWRIKHVGALSIPMMCIQTPGAILMVLSIALRPGTNWTSACSFLFSCRSAEWPKRVLS